MMKVPGEQTIHKTSRRTRDGLAIIISLWLLLFMSGLAPVFADMGALESRTSKLDAVTRSEIPSGIIDIDNSLETPEEEKYKDVLESREAANVVGRIDELGSALSALRTELKRTDIEEHAPDVHHDWGSDQSAFCANKGSIENEKILLDQVSEVLGRTSDTVSGAKHYASLLENSRQKLGAVAEEIALNKGGLEFDAIMGGTCGTFCAAWLDLAQDSADEMDAITSMLRSSEQIARKLTGEVANRKQQLQAAISGYELTGCNRLDLSGSWQWKTISPRSSGIKYYNDGFVALRGGSDSYSGTIVFDNHSDKTMSIDVKKVSSSGQLNITIDYNDPANVAEWGYQPSLIDRHQCQLNNAGDKIDCYRIFGKARHYNVLTKN